MEAKYSFCGISALPEKGEHMNDTRITEKRRLTWGLLFVGFCCLFGCLGTSFILVTQYTNSRHFESFEAVAHTILLCLLSNSFFIVIGAIAFVWAIRRLKRTERKEGLIAKSLIPAACLTPLLAIGGVAVIIMTPFVFAHARKLVWGPNIVQRQFSPDGQYLAYVADLPSIDGPNHHLYVQETASGEVSVVATLPEDVDFNEEILWSPNNDIVVFRTHFRLIAYGPSSGTKEEFTLGGEYHWRQNGTFWVDYNDVKKPVEMRFPEAGMFACNFEGTEEPCIITLAQDRMD